MKGAKNLENEEKNLLKLNEEKANLKQKNDEILQKIEEKKQKIRRLSEKKDNLSKENNDISLYHTKLLEKYETKFFKKRNFTNTGAEEIAEDDDEKEVENKLEDKIDFNLEQYLTELENSIKKEIIEQNKSLSNEGLSQERGSGVGQVEGIEYQKSNVRAVCIKNIIGMNKKGLSTDDKMGITFNTFKISKKTKIKDLKAYALKFWQVSQANRIEVQDLYELVDMEKNQLQIANEDAEVDATMAKLSEQKLSTLTLRRKLEVDEKKLGLELGMTESQTLIPAAKKEGEETQGDQSKKKATNSKDKELQDQAKNKKSDIIKAYDKFFSGLPLLRSYFPFEEKDIVIKNDNQQLKIGLSIDDYSCLAFVFIFLLFLLTLLQLLSNENLKPYSFMKVDSFSMMKLFLTNSSFSEQLFESTSELQKNYFVVGSIRIRNVRTRKATCRSEYTDTACYYPTYTEVTKEKNSINFGSFEYESYYNSQQAGTTRYVNGQFDSYDSSGYIYDIQNNLDFQHYTVQMIDLFETKVLDHPSIRAIIIQFTVMSKEDGTYVFFELVAENTSFGFFPSYKASIFSKQIEDSSFQCSLDPKLYICILFTLFYLNQIIQNGFSYVFSLTGLLNIFIQIFVYLFINQECTLIDLRDTSGGVWTDFFDLGSKIQHYSLMTMQNKFPFNQFFGALTTSKQLPYLSNRFQSVALGSCLLRMAFFMEFYDSFRKIMQSISHGISTLYFSMIYICLIIFSLSIVLSTYWGQTVEQVNTLTKSFFSILLMIIGCFDYTKIPFDITALIFFFIIFLYLAFFLMNILTVMHIDEYRQIVLLYGDQPSVVYSFKDKLRWFISFLPDRIQDHILKR